MTTECDCGRPVAPRQDVCATCLAEEIAQGLRKAPLGALGIPHRAGTPEYRRAYRRLKAEAGRCSVCTGRPAREGIAPTGKPYRTCAVCGDKDAESKAERAERGVCAHCNAPVKPGSTICPHHHAIALSRQRRARGSLAGASAGAYALDEGPHVAAEED